VARCGSERHCCPTERPSVCRHSGIPASVTPTDSAQGAALTEWNRTALCHTAVLFASSSSLCPPMILLETGNRILGETVAAQLKAPSVPPTDSSSSSSSTHDRHSRQRQGAERREQKQHGKHTAVMWPLG
jgi:hypothetical protein